MLGYRDKDRWDMFWEVICNIDGNGILISCYDLLDGNQIWMLDVGVGGWIGLIVSCLL
ncbi:hypothetical protein [Candidatus Hodgkinia cicadicola]|uniref:hypothetical protein n=1 Tax=Candidatus Hodgkinia cicadicola TaxID=573658 RepID=UPI001788C4EE